MWKKSFKNICHFHKCTPDETIFIFTDNPNEWCNYLIHITHKKIIKRDLELPVNNIDIDNIEISKPKTLKGDLLEYFPDNFIKIFSMYHLLCKEHNKHINHFHFLEHAEISEEDLNKLLKEREKEDEPWRETWMNYLQQKMERTKIEGYAIKREKKRRDN